MDRCGSGGRCATGGFKNSFCRGRVTGQLASRPSWSHNQLTAAVGANAIELTAGAVAAGRAFKGVDARLRRLAGQILVAAFAVGAELEHGKSDAVWV